MKISRCLMDEVTVDLAITNTGDLAGMTSFSIGDGIRDHLWLVITKSSKPVSELRSGLVRSAHTVMSFFERLLCFLIRKSSE